LLDLQLHMQSVPVTTKVVSSNHAHGEVYLIQLYVLNIREIWNAIKNGQSTDTDNIGHTRHRTKTNKT